MRKPLLIVDGGKRRQDSVLNCLKALDPACDMVLVHDSARPFIDHELVSRVIEGVSASGACICGVPVKGTVKRVAGLYVDETIDRSTLWEIQTPQGFTKDVILKAYERYGDADVTDDASLVERLGVRVKVVPGSYWNIKVTTPEDIVLGQAIAKCRKRAV
jgi:2-C-methyl-D-erythritol 4-phosphate cytidylyltransferase